MPSKIKTLLITNYKKDNQFSMLKFGELMMSNRDKNESIKLHEIFPNDILNKWSFSSKISKWTAYIDKYLIFPNRLAKYLKSKNQNFDLVHIIDHSNSPYIKTVKLESRAKCLVTCHDLIAIRSSLGEFPSAPKTSLTGKKLQSWIYDAIIHANYYVCDSIQTKVDLNKLIPNSKGISHVIHLGTNFHSINFTNKHLHELNFIPSKTEYLLHVGSAAWYKNRKAVLETYRHLRQIDSSNDLKLVLVGPAPQSEEMNQEMKKWIQCNLDNIYSFSNVSDQLLSSLYKNAIFLIFPSFIEGFGWPPLEAMSVGCPVITTKTGAIHDLLGDNALYIDPSDQKSINKRAVKLYLEKKKIIKHKVSLPSYENCRKNYLQLYRELLED